MRMRLVVLLALGTLLVGCGRTGSNLQWPAHVASLQGFDDANSTKVRDYISALNSRLGEQVLTLDSALGSSIEIKLVNDFASSGSTSERISASSGGLKIAGRAIVEDDHCTIEIGKFIVNDSNQNLLQPVLWHEIGHCAGLTHLQTTDQIMSPTTVSWQNYSQDALKKFFSDFLGSSGLTEPR